jgi:hypothetical protein
VADASEHCNESLVFKKASKLLISSATVTFSRRTMPLGVYWLVKVKPQLVAKLAGNYLH